MTRAAPASQCACCQMTNHTGLRQAKKDSPLETPMVDRTSQVLVWGSVVGTVAIAAVSL